MADRLRSSDSLQVCMVGSEQAAVLLSVATVPDVMPVIC